MIMSGGKKYYAVATGRKTGVFDSWVKCEKQVSGYSGALFKSFKNINDAQNFVSQQKSVSHVPKPNNSNTSSLSKQSTSHVSKPNNSNTSSLSKQKSTNHAPKPNNSNTNSLSKQKSANHALRSNNSNAGNLSKRKSANHAPRSNNNNKNSLSEQKSANHASTSNDSKKVVIYTDGCCKHNGNENVTKKAGVGVYFGNNDPRNISEPLPGALKTNQRAELYACVKALHQVEINVNIEIKSDSIYLVDGMNKWRHNWVNKKDGLQRPNSDLWKLLIEMVDRRVGNTEFSYVKGHSGIEGNEMADILANRGI